MKSNQKCFSKLRLYALTLIKRCKNESPPPKKNRMNIIHELSEFILKMYVYRYRHTSVQKKVKESLLIKSPLGVDYAVKKSNVEMSKFSLK